jgi:hypothetical protein
VRRGRESDWRSPGRKNKWPCAAADFFLKNGAKVVLMGNSITAQHL